MKDTNIKYDVILFGCKNSLGELDPSLIIIIIIIIIDIKNADIDIKTAKGAIWEMRILFIFFSFLFIKWHWF